MESCSESIEKKDVYQMFDRISKTYDLNNHLLSFGLDFYWRKKLAKHLPSFNSIRLLDLATGTGDQIFALMKRCRNIKAALGLDLAHEMLTIGNRKLTNKPYAHQVSFMHGNATDVDVKDQCIECVTMSFGIRNVDDVPRCLKEMHRILTIGGRALILEFSLPKNSLLRKFHLFYLRYILPRLGGLISKDKSAYTYLNQTIESFPYGNAFCTLLQSAGFQNAKAIPLNFGIVTLYVAEKSS